MAQLIPPFLANAFERMGASNKSIEQVAVNTGQTAAAVSVGGDLYEKIDELVKAFKGDKGGAGGKVSIKEALALRITAGALKPLGLGLGIIIDALDRAPEGKELKLKMEALTNGLLALSGVAWSIVKFAALMILALPLLILAGGAMLLIVPLLKLMVDGLLWATKKLDEKNIKQIVALGDVGKALLWLGASLVLLYLISEYALKGLLVAGAVLLGFGLIFMLLAKMKMNPRQMGQFARNLRQISLSLLAIGVTLVLMSLLAKEILIGLGTAMLVLLGIAGVFWLIDKMQVDKAMRKAGRAFLFAAAAILGVSIALVLSHLILSGIGFEEVAKVMLVVAGVGLVFGIIGTLFAKPIEKGGRALIFAAIAIAGLAIAIFIMNLVLGDFDTKDVIRTFKVLAVIGGIAIVFGLAGLGASFIKKGSIAMMFAGGAMVVIAIGIWAMMKATQNATWPQIGMVAAVIVGVGLAFGIAGAGPIPGFIALGAVAMALAGLALLPIALGTAIMLKAVKDASWEKIGMIGAIIGGLAIAMGLAGLGAMFIAPGAAVMILAGVALISVGKGLEALNKVDFNKLGDVNKTGSGAFNWSGQMTSGFLGMFKRRKTNFEVAMESIADGLSLGPMSIIGIMAGAPTLILAGLALKEISNGLLEFDGISKKINMAVLSFNVAFMTTVLADAFGAIGKRFPGGKKSLMQSIFGGGTQSAVADGISSVMGMGGALTSIAVGMQAMANLKFPIKYDKEGNPIEFETMASDAPQKVAINAGIITSVLGNVFGEIGKKYPGGKKSLMESIFGGGKPSPVADGISSVMGMGDALTGIAKGFQSMANLNFPVEWDKDGKPTKFENIDINGSLPKVLANTWMIVTGLSGVFAQIGSNPDAQSPGWFGRSTIQKGIDIVMGIGTPLINLAKGVEQMANLKFPTGFDKDGKATGYTSIGDPKNLMQKLTANTQMLIQALVETFTIIGKEEGTNDGGFWWWEKSSFEKGVQIVKAIAEPYEKLGKGIKNVVDIVGKLDSKAFAGKVTDIIKVFTTIGSTSDLAAFYAASHLANVLGSTYEKLGKAIPAIAGAKIDEKSAKAYQSLIFGKVDEGKAIEGYYAQSKAHMSMGWSVSKAGENFPKIQNAINSLDLTKLTESRKMFEALAVLSKGGNADDILKKLGDSLEEAMKKLAEMIQDLAKVINEQGTNPSTPAPGGNTTPTGNTTPAPAIKFPDTMKVTVQNWPSKGGNTLPGVLDNIFGP